jgi:hypothetical protein
MSFDLKGDISHCLVYKSQTHLWMQTLYAFSLIMANDQDEVNNGQNVGGLASGG